MKILHCYGLECSPLAQICLIAGTPTSFLPRELRGRIKEGA
jgi:hypothetical protein